MAFLDRSFSSRCQRDKVWRTEGVRLGLLLHGCMSCSTFTYNWLKAHVLGFRVSKSERELPSRPGVHRDRCEGSL